MKNNVVSEPFYGYDPLRDVSAVDQFGFLNLRDAYLNNSIPGEITSDVDSFNGVADPASLIGKSTDVFDAYRKAEYVKGAEAARAAAAEAAAASTASTE